jgi:hypothetical protein
VKISYRMLSAVVLVVLVAVIFVPTDSPIPLPVDGGPAFDPCTMWVTVHWTYRLPRALWLVTFAIVMVQGLRNRTTSRTIALVSLASLGVTIHYEWWEVSRCSSRFGVASFIFCTSTIALLCLLHLFQPGWLTRHKSVPA